MRRWRAAAVACVAAPATSPRAAAPTAPPHACAGPGAEEAAPLSAGAGGGGGGPLSSCSSSCRRGVGDVVLTPRCAAGCITAAAASPTWGAAGGDEARAEVGFDAAAALREARRLSAPRPPLTAAEPSALHLAKERYISLLHHSPMDETLRHELRENVYARLYDVKERRRVGLNLTDGFLSRMDGHARRGWAPVDGRASKVRQLRTRPPVYIVDGFLTHAECAEYIRLYEQQRARFWRTPRVCFQRGNAHMSKHPVLAPHISSPGESSSRVCLSQHAAAAVHTAAEPSYSYSAHLGPDSGGARDELSERIARVAALPGAHGYKLQLLAYGENASYGGHVDCDPRPLTAMNRAVTALLYLNDDFDGGETVFPWAHGGSLTVRPRAGSLLLWYNFDGDACSPHTYHLARAVRRGRKYAAQRWYSYPSDPFNSEMGLPPNLPDHRPFQPYVSCDIANVANTSASGAPPPPSEDTAHSCRWYDQPGFEFATVPNARGARRRG